MINKKGAFSMTRDLQLTLFAQRSWRFIHNQAPENTRTAHTNGADPQMPRRTRKPEKKQIDQYDHKEAKCTNTPRVGLVTPKTDWDTGKKIYAYDPSLQFGSHRSQIDMELIETYSGIESLKIVEVEQ